MLADRSLDLALLSISTGPFPTLGLASSVTTGESVAASGFDNLAYQYFLSSGDLQPDFHPGNVSSVRGLLVVDDVPTDPGNSGGPLFDVDSGEVVGVVEGSFNKNYYAAVGLSAITPFLREAKVDVGVDVAVVTEELDALSNSIPFETSYMRNVTTSIQVSGCAFSISQHWDGAGHVDETWTGSLNEIDPATVIAPTDVYESKYWGFGFASKLGEAFDYQGYDFKGGMDTQHRLFVAVERDPTSLVTPFRTLIERCSNSSEGAGERGTPRNGLRTSRVRSRS